MKHLFNLCLAVGMTSAFNASAATIYSQTNPAEPSAAFGSSDFPIAQKIADNFSISGAQPVAVRSLRFIGSPGLGDAQLDNFRVVFFEDVAGKPGPPLAGGDFDIGSAFSREPTGGQLLNGTSIPTEYAINSPNVLLLEPNLTYWVSVTNDLLPAAGWAWARANGNLDLGIASTNNDIATGPWTTGLSRGGMWFELNDHTVPEPSSLAITLLAFTAIAFKQDRAICCRPSVG